MTTSPVKFSEASRQFNKEMTLREYRHTGDKSLLADLVSCDNWPEGTEFLRDEIVRLIMKGVKTDLPLLETKHGKAVNAGYNYMRVLWFMNRMKKTENEACIEVAAYEKVPVETIRTQVKKCKADPYYDYYTEEWVWGWFDDEAENELK